MMAQHGAFSKFMVGWASQQLRQKSIPIACQLVRTIFSAMEKETHVPTKSESRKRNAIDQSTKNSIKKKKSSEKERVRNLQIKQLLEEIRYHVPFVEKNLSKIRTLRLASEYINHLRRIINGEMVHCQFTGSYRALMLDDFKHVVMKEMQVTNSYKERAEIELNMSPKIQEESQLEESALFNPIQMANYNQYTDCKDFAVYRFA